MTVRLLLLILLSFVASLPAQAKNASPCTAESKSVRFYPGDNGFVEAVERHNRMVEGSATEHFRSKTESSWQLSSADAAFVEISYSQSKCGVVSAVEKFNCTEVGCNEGIPGTGDLGVGATLTTTSCNANTFVVTTTTWTKQQNGSWTVTTRNSQQHTHCDSI